MLKKMLLAAAIAALSLAEAPQAALPKNVTKRNYFRSGSDSLLFNRPIAVKAYPGEDSSYAVVQQSGQIISVRWVDGAWRRTDTAAISGLAGGTSGGDEQGLLGLAFHPNFKVSGKYYLFYVTGTGTARASWIVERIAQGASPRLRTSDAARTVMRFSNPDVNHNGGTIGFGPDGYLYAGLGDGGGQGDPGNRAQTKNEILGKFLRIDVNGADAFPDDTTRNYAIPESNPFKDSSAYRPEIWALGVRNPWKWTFHPTTGELWAGDVGQNAYEEITRVPKGANLGWKIREAASCYNASSCTSAGLLPPALTLERGIAASVTGGAFFTGNPASAYHNAYIFSDYVREFMWAARDSAGVLVDTTRIGTLENGVSFDRTSRGEVLATSIGMGNNAANTGRVFILESPDMQPGPVNLRHAARPFAKAFTLAEFRRDPTRFTVHGLDGREIQGKFQGMVMVREKGSSAPAQLMTLIW